MPAAAAVAEASIAPPPLVPATAVEEGEATAETTASQAVLEQPADTVPGGGDVVMVLDEDATPPLMLGNRDTVMTPAPEPTPAVAAIDSSPAVEVPEPSPAAEVPGPSTTKEVAESSSARDALTIEEVMELATCRYIDFPGVGVIDLEAPQLPEKVLEVVMERMFAEPSIMDTIASVSKALQEYESAGSFAPVVAAEAALEAPVASSGPTADAPASPPANGSREASLPSRQKLLKLQPPLRRPAWLRRLSERLDRRCLAQSPPRSTRFAPSTSLPLPPRNKPLPREQ
jgi:hypothetical protein